MRAYRQTIANVDSPSHVTRIILVRHGRSTFNEQGRYQGSSNASVLNEQGMETATVVGKYLQHTSIDSVYVSPLQRVQQTAYKILQARAPSRPPPVTISNDLKEISLAQWEGLTYEQVQQNFSVEYRCWQQTPHKFELPINPACVSPPSQGIAVAKRTYFPVQNLYQQAQRFWATALPRHRGQTLLVVSHAGTNHALISTALGASPAHHHSLQQSNCGISVLDFSGQDFSGQKSPGQDFSTGSVQLKQLNHTSPLGESLPKLKRGKHGLRLLLLPAEALTETDCQLISQRLTTQPVDFCLAASSAQSSVQALLKQHPTTLQLTTGKPDFLQDWQRHLWPQQGVPCRTNPLMTGLAIAPASSIQNVLLKTLGADLSKHVKISLSPGHFSVIHYPYDNAAEQKHRPVVQAINT